MHNQKTSMLQDTVSKLRTENFELKQQSQQVIWLVLSINFALVLTGHYAAISVRWKI